jgi:hypothetical protein
MRVLCKENENYPEIEVDKSYEAIPMILNPGTVDYMGIHRMLENAERSIREYSISK